jgi:predicted ABC-type ATPase
MVPASCSNGMKGTQKNSPIVYVLAGPNGAGKTTFALEFLPDFVQCREFLNADLIAAGLAPFAPETQNVRAGRLLLERIAALASEGVSFGFETTLSGRTYFKLLGDMKAKGYRVFLYFLWLPNAKTAVTRVENRVKQGGHSVPVGDIRRRYAAGVQNLFQIYLPIFDCWWLFDASRFPPALIASAEEGGLRTIKHEKLYQRIENQGEKRREKKDS